MKNLQKTFLKKSEHRAVVAIHIPNYINVHLLPQKDLFLSQSKSFMPHPQSPRPGNKGLGKDRRLPCNWQAYSILPGAAWVFGGTRGGMRGEGRRIERREAEDIGRKRGKGLE